MRSALNDDEAEFNLPKTKNATANVSLADHQRTVRVEEGGEAAVASQ